MMERSDPLLVVDGLKKYYPVGRSWGGRRTRWVRAVDGVSFEIGPRETFGLVGETGSGKSTVGRTVLRLTEPTGGRIRFLGRDVGGLNHSELRELRREMQMVFQDPYGALNPRMTVGELLAEPLMVHGIGTPRERAERIRELLAVVGLPAAAAQRYPHEFSGGQRQRVGIARALAVGPRLIVADEPVSALDVSVQSQILNLFLRLQETLGVAYLFIAHGLQVVRHLAHRVGVMYLGQLVELADTDTLFGTPRHPYTEALLSAAPVPDPRRRRQRILLPGDPPSPLDLPSGCRFHPRCSLATDECRVTSPEWRETAPGHWVACHWR